MTAKLKCDPLKLPEPKLPKPKVSEPIKTSTPWEAMDRKKRLKKSRDWKKVNRGVNNGKYGAPRFWTPERNAIILKLHEEGKTFAQIGEEFGKTSDAVRRQWYNIRDGRAQTK